ncbi:MAG: hypothetical protein ACE5GD_01875 [Candidatus Geothermarchaeales archaeon]
MFPIDELLKLKRRVIQRLNGLVFFLYALFVGTFTPLLPSLCTANCLSCCLCAPLLTMLPIMMIASTKGKVKGSFMKKIPRHLKRGKPGTK